MNQTIVRLWQELDKCDTNYVAECVAKIVHIKHDCRKMLFQNSFKHIINRKSYIILLFS